MLYELRLDIGCDENRWTWEEFYQERNCFYNEMITRFKKYHGKIDDLWVVFEEGTPELADALVKICTAQEYIYDIGTFPRYTREDVWRARFLILAADVSRGRVDCDREWAPLNEYKARLCGVCGRKDDSQPPSPFFIYQSAMKKRQDIFKGSMVVVLSYDAFDKLKDDLEPWVKFGNAQVVDKNRKLVRNEREYVWIWPKYQVGPFSDMVVKRRCEECNEPTEVREVRTTDIFTQNMCIVTSFCDSNAPIVRAGNWFGEITPERPNGRHYYIFITPALYEKMLKLKVRGLCETACVVHAADKPYDWDPLKNYHPK
jgi:hypothetical protein